MKEFKFNNINRIFGNHLLVTTHHRSYELSQRLINTLCFIPFRNERTYLSLVTMKNGNILIHRKFLVASLLGHVYKDDLSLLELCRSHFEGILCSSIIIYVARFNHESEFLNRQISICHHCKTVRMGVPSFFPKEKRVYISKHMKNYTRGHHSFHHSRNHRGQQIPTSSEPTLDTTS